MGDVASLVLLTWFVKARLEHAHPENLAASYLQEGVEAGQPLDTTAGRISWDADSCEPPGYVLPAFRDVA